MMDFLLESSMTERLIAIVAAFICAEIVITATKWHGFIAFTRFLFFYVFFYVVILLAVYHI